MKTIFRFLTVAVLFASGTSRAEAICRTGQLSIRAGDGNILLNFMIKDNELSAAVANPNDVLHAGGQTKKVSEIFDPGPNVKLVPYEGLKCPDCLGLKSENGKFTFVIEHLGGDAVRTSVNYFNMASSIVKDERCPAPAKETNSPEVAK